MHIGLRKIAPFCLCPVTELYNGHPSELLDNTMQVFCLFLYLELNSFFQKLHHISFGKQLSFAFLCFIKRMLASLSVTDITACKDCNSYLMLFSLL